MFARIAVCSLFAAFCFLPYPATVWGTPVQDNCLFNWVETSYPALFAPAGTASISAGTYYGRLYSGTNTILVSESNSAHLWAAAGSSVFDLGPLSGWYAVSGCLASTGSETEVRALLDKVVSLPNQVTDSGLEEQIEPILLGFLGMGQSVCPTVASNLNLAAVLAPYLNPQTGTVDLMTLLNNIPSIVNSLPDPLTASVNYGAGCTTELGDQMSGGVNLTVTGLDWNLSTNQITGNLLLVVANLTRNGQLLANGQISASLNASMADETATATVQLNNFFAGSGSPVNGTIALNVLSESDIRATIDLNDGADLQVNLPLSMQVSDEDVVTLRTVTPGTVNGYTVTINNLLFDGEQCEEYPIGGFVTFSKGGESWRATFNASCNGAYTMTHTP